MKSNRHFLRHSAKLLPLALGLGLVALGGCSADTTDGNTDGNQDTQQVETTQAKSELQRNTNPDVAAADRAELRDGNNAFSLEMYQQLAKDAKGKNVWISPTSISLALAMTYAGARGDTAKQMAQALHYTLPAERLHKAFNDLDLQLASRGTKPVEKDRKPLKLHLANSMWMQQGYHFEKKFLDTIAVNYGAGLNLLDFGADPDGSRQVINRWVENKTEGFIKDLLPEGSISGMTRFVIANAIYFKGSWQYPFEKNSTSDATFHAPDGDVTVPMMGQETPAHLAYAKGADYQAVRLPYAGGEADMTIILPDQGSFESVQAGLTPAWLAKVDEALGDEKAKSKPVDLRLPKFSFYYSRNLARGPMQALGMKDAFTAKADFSGMDGTRSLFISGIYHKAFVAVDEDGTTAAAATAVVGDFGAVGPQESIEMVVDRPFLFYIRDVPTGTILFLGRVMDPTQE